MLRILGLLVALVLAAGCGGSGDNGQTNDADDSTTPTADATTPDDGANGGDDEDATATPTPDEGERDDGEGQEDDTTPAADVDAPEDWETFEQGEFEGYRAPDWEVVFIEPSDLQDSDFAEGTDLDPEFVEQALAAVEEAGEPLLLVIVAESETFTANINVLPCQSSEGRMPGADDIVAEYDASGIETEIIEDEETGLQIVRAQFSEQFDTYQLVLGSPECFRIATLSVESGDTAWVDDFALFSSLLRF